MFYRLQSNVVSSLKVVVSVCGLFDPFEDKGSSLFVMKQKNLVFVRRPEKIGVFA